MVRAMVKVRVGALVAVFLFLRHVTSASAFFV